MLLLPLLLLLSTTAHPFSAHPAPRTNQTRHPITYDPPIDYGPHDGVTPQIRSLLWEHAPVIYLHPEEVWWPCSVEFMLQRFELLDEKNKPNISLPLPPLSPSSLGTLPLPQPPYPNLPHLSLPIPPSPHPPSNLGLGAMGDKGVFNAQPSLKDSRVAYLYGPGGQTEAERRARNLRGNMGRDEEDGSGEEKRRGKVRAPVYGFHVQQEDGIVDLIYWTYYPYNFGKEVKPLGILGNHISDWEHVKVRTRYGKPISADYMVHSDLSTTGTLRWGDVPKEDGRLVAFSALGSHGLWPAVGEHMYINAWNILKLVDSTAKGALWDSRDNLIPIQWLNTSAPAWPFKRRHDPHSPLGWLNFRGRWGNKGDALCWWGWVKPVCQFGDGPFGPNREFRAPPQCIIAPLASSPTTSTFKFKIDPAPVRRANMRGMRYVELTQTCSRWRETMAGSRGSGNDALNDMVTQGQLASLAAREDVKLRTNVPLHLHDHSFKITTRSCPAHHAVSSYTLTMCNSKGRCRWPSIARDVCTYVNGTDAGYTSGRSVEMDDPDPWTFFDWSRS